MRSVLSLILIYCLMNTYVFAQSVNPNDQLKLGKASSVSDKGIVFDTNDGVSNKKLLVEKISKKLKWDGNSVQIGDGSAGTDKEIVIAGALKSLKYNGTTGEFEFNDDVKLSASLKTDFLQAVNTEVAINSLLRATQGIKVGSGANTIRVNAGNLEFSNDGTLFKKFGTGTGGASTGTSILDNASFEDGISTSWTSSGGTFTQGTYTNGVEGNTKYAQFVASGSGQYFETALFTIPTNFSGGCQADFKKVNVSANDLFKVEVLDSSANVLTNGNVKLSSWVKFPTINFTCPSAGTQIKLRVTSLSAGTIQVDDAYLGSNQNIVNISQARSFGNGTYSPIAGCSFATGSVTFVGFSANASCNTLSVSGSIKAPLTKIPAFVIPAGSPAGTYVAVVSGIFSKAGTTAEDNKWRLHDGTSAWIGQGYNYSGTTNASANGGFTASFSYTSTQTTDLTVQVQGATSNASTTSATINVADANAPLQFQVYFYPSGQETAVSPEQASWFIDANIGGANPTTGGATSSYTAISNSSLDLVINSSKGSASAEIPCDSTNPSTGLTCSVGNESIGVAFIPPMSGRYKVCVEFSAGLSTATDATYQLVETPNNAQTILSEGLQKIYNEFTGSGYRGQTICGNFNFSDTSKKTIRLMYEQQSASGPVILADRGATNGQRDIHFTVENLSFGQNRPILVDTPIVKSSYYSSVSGTSSVTQPINFDTKEFESSHNSVSTGSSWKFTAPPNLGGLYEIKAKLDLTSIANGIFIWKNGVKYKYFCYEGGSGSTDPSCSTNIYLNQGDYFDLRADSSATYIGGALNTSSANTISITRLGL